MRRLNAHYSREVCKYTVSSPTILHDDVVFPPLNLTLSQNVVRAVAKLVAAKQNNYVQSKSSTREANVKYLPKITKRTVFQVVTLFSENPEC